MELNLTNIISNVVQLVWCVDSLMAALELNLNGEHDVFFGFDHFAADINIKHQLS